MRLNDQQVQIVEFPMDTPALVMAGAGSGKTTVIAHRAKRLSQLIPEGTTLQMLTFSNKAAAEMKERVKRIGQASDLSRIRFDTFHSFGIKLLKNDPQGYALPEGFSLLNETDTKRSIRGLAKKFGLSSKVAPEDRKRLDPMSWLNTWSLARQAGYDVRNPNNKTVLCERLATSHALSAEETLLAWSTLKGYEAEKVSSGSVDFDDLLYLPLIRLARDELYRKTVQTSIGYLVVDEAQDTNRIQYEIIKRIAHSHCGVTCVGDDDQSIYGWRGAEVSNLRRFLSHFSAAELRLEENYRSTQRIVQTASVLIQNNESRLDKSPFSTGEQGESPDLKQFPDSHAMADAIASTLAVNIKNGVLPKDLAVLYRTNRMAMLLEQSLRRWSVPYHVVGGMSLFDRAEVMAVTCALRLARNPRDIFALKSITPFIDGFGQGSAYTVIDWLEADSERTLEVLPSELPGISQRRIKAINDFFSELIFIAVTSETVDEFVNWIVDGPMAVLEREKDDQLRERRAHHLEALVRDINEEVSERQQAEPKLTWRDVMIEVALRDARQSEAESGQVTLSTLHRSKGLEWPVVIIAGASEGLLPLDSKSDLSEEDAGYSHIEEERRLAYVGLTRAKTACTFFHADKYFFPGNNMDRQYEPSRFLFEMGLDVKSQISPSHQELEVFGEEDSAEAFKRAFSKLAL
ncbi:hypothetical protein HMPREF1487_09476 [Pseudomonas sp. HPB0071]|uniref:DNA 3'-5' helicase n=1 Tax=Pseudomonas luteola TaxID=47886 RepID=A0A2X2BUD3_PSELU|nr:MULTISPECIES: ATP-dependent helicase [Pseudomonas]ENA26997.1 hypothetical protein HMPREF1487_09476 [Pseudomonas sp. HPB0071]MBA1250175.1 ATP-dependent helicase [Pseudomonas zeshuii]MBH3440926.1 ATP-dependent helicase [Pseudomonas luteola]SPY99972.1 DNA-dependent helicase II [Pseudomonas luteola]